MKNIGIIDCGHGNIRSVHNAFSRLGATVHIVKASNDFKDVDGLVLPGVGTFGNCMDNLKKSGFDDGIKNFIQSGNPFLGICIGFQVMMAKGYEGGEHDGLNIFDGVCEHIRTVRDTEIDAPHIGWAEVEFEKGSEFYPKPHGKEYLYFNHSYVCRLNDNNVQAWSSHKKKWPVVVKKDNVVGIQGHPEKSHRVGLAFLKSFLELKE